MPAKSTKAAKKSTTSSSDAKLAKTSSLEVGALVAHTYEDVPTGAKVTTKGIITEITDDGAYVAPLSAAAVVPLDELKAL